MISHVTSFKLVVLGSLLALFFVTTMFSQGAEVGDIGVISGSVQLDVQTYSEDTLIEAPAVNEKMLSNAFVNLLFTKGKFTAGLRFESYQNPLLGIDSRYGTSGEGTGLGIPYRFASYVDETFEVTAGNFYEQFGTGMILRSYEERNLGFDNSIDGIRLRFIPLTGLRITGLIGRQRAFFELSQGVMRGGDISADFATLLDSLLPDDLQLRLGASVMSRYQPDRNDFLKLPENVLAWSLRSTIGWRDIALETEYAYKINDPGVANSNSFNPGNALYASLSYTRPGLGINLAAKRIDNMDFRSDRSAGGLAQQVNFLPPLAKQHSWRLITLYPYATQNTGEFGIQADIIFTIPKGSFLGLDETVFSINFSKVNALDTTNVSPFRYESKLMWAPREYFRDLNIEVQRKWGKDFKTTLAFISVKYDQDIIQGLSSDTEKKYGVISANLVVLELWLSVMRGHTLRSELQYMAVKHEPGVQFTTQNGSWIMGLLEYSVSPSWFFTVFDEYNYGNNDPSLQVHYPSASVAFVRDALRVQGGYGRVRGGLLCVGGICRPVPASNGFTLGVTYTF
ncbi:MAG: DUF6029 family protein [bacterium]|nr:DUF6029 family protein [bacterium]